MGRLTKYLVSTAEVLSNVLMKLMVDENMYVRLGLFVTFYEELLT